MDTNTLIIFMLSICGVGILLIFGFLLIRIKKNKGTSKDQLRRSLNKAGAKNSVLGKTAFYQKVYLKLASTPFISRYLFKTRMRLEMVRFSICAHDPLAVNHLLHSPHKLPFAVWQSCIFSLVSVKQILFRVVGLRAFCLGFFLQALKHFCHIITDRDLQKRDPRLGYLPA